jgi:transcriptional regulator with XRE-family HTH domain
VKEKETLGEFLKRERELKNISLRELSKNTRVREHLLKAIEGDRYDLLPSPIYVRGFLSAYAKYVSLDSHDVLLRYERSLKGEEIIPSEVKSERKPLRKAIWNRKQIWMVSGVIAISLLISYFLHPYLSGIPNKQEVREALPIITTTQTPEVSPAVEGKPFSLELKAIEETWVKIQANGQSQTEAFFKPGEGSSYQATNRIELLIGNAGGLDMVFNGRMLERFGKSGEVVTLVFTPQGVERKRPEERKSP